MKKLRLSQTHKLVAGVLGGLGEYLKVDPVVVRLLFIVLLVLTGIFPGAMLYLIAWVLIPEGTAFAPSTPVAPKSESQAETTASAPIKDVQAEEVTADDSRSV